ncbi:AIDA repeat-containing protein [Pantoea ananatis]
MNSGSNQYIYSGGSATVTTVNSGGNQHVIGVATSTTVNSGGYQTIYSGGSATSTTVNSGATRPLAAAQPSPPR